PVVPPRVLILDVVVDEREVMEQLNCRTDRRHARSVAAERLEHQAAEERSKALSTTGAAGVQAEVVQHHPVEGAEGRLALRQERADLVIDGGDPGVGQPLPPYQSPQ